MTSMTRLTSDHEAGEDQRRPLDQRDVALLHRVDDQRAEAGQREGHLDIDRAGEQPDDDDAGGGDDRDQRVAEHVGEGDARRAHAARPGEDDVVLVQLLDHRGARDLHHDRHHRQRERDRRQRQVPEPVDEAAARPEGREPAEHDAEDVEQEDAGDEGRRGNAEDAEHHHRAVEPRAAPERRERRRAGCRRRARSPC